MKTLLLILSLLTSIKVAHTQHNMWGVAPHVVMDASRGLGMHLKEQTTNEKGQLFLYYPVKAGWMMTYIFESQRLIAIVDTYDPTIVSPITPRGIEKHDGDKMTWFDYENNTFTRRSYKGNLVIDAQAAIE